MTAQQLDDRVDQPAGGRRLRTALLAVLAVCALVIAAALGWAVGNRSSPSSVASVSAVDIGFAQDMSTHHKQAVTMANYERDNTADPALHLVALDIESEQQYQVGEMQGWLNSWNVSTNNTSPMAWMGHDHMSMGAGALMPGMATPAQLSRLESLKGRPLDILFLQLMIHHHQGGVPMAQYAAAHASTAYVRRLADTIVTAQSAEIVQMERALRQLGGQQLPAPAQ